MAYTNVEPTSHTAERKMTAVGAQIQELIRSCIFNVWQVPETDILVMLCENKVLVPDPKAQLFGVIPDLVIKIYTSDIELQPLADALKERILTAWAEQLGTDIKVEIWIQFFHTWGTNIVLP